jgi:hypothetical protein
VQSEQLSIVYAGATIIVRAISIPRSFSSSDLAPPPAGVAPRAAAARALRFQKSPFAGTRARRRVAGSRPTHRISIRRLTQYNLGTAPTFRVVTDLGFHLFKVAQPTHL